MPSIAFFKRGFGCDLVPYYAVEGYKSGWVKRALGMRPSVAWVSNRDGLTVEKMPENICSIALDG